MTPEFGKIIHYRGRKLRGASSLVKLSVLIFAAACGHSFATTPDSSPPPSDAMALDSTVVAIKRKLIVLFGQSNAGSQGIVSELSDQTLAEPYPAVPFAQRQGGAPSSTFTDYPLDALGPRDVGGIQRFGIELTMGRALDKARPNGWAIAKMAIGDTSLGGHWHPEGGWPTIDDNLFTQEIAYAKDVASQTDSDIAALIWIQGEKDAESTILAPRYKLELTEFIGDERQALGASDTLPFIYGRLNALNPGAGAADVRSGQEFDQNTHAIMVDQDPYPLRIGDVHYTTQAVLDLGEAYATVVLAAIEQ